MINRRILRCLILCLVAAVAIKILIFMISGQNLSVENLKEQLVEDHKEQLAEEQSKPDPQVREDLGNDEKVEDHAPLAASKIPTRIVHLDLKGAPPKVDYLGQIFPLLSALGADGILLEYEDMFPYEGDLQILRSPYAYSVKDIEEIKTLAQLNRLEVIPLVQMFGHLEFVLKHEKYFPLREVEAFPNSLNPHHTGTLPLVKELVKQVMGRHPEARWLHIGADEVRGLGESHDSKKWLKNNKGNLGEMFLNYVTSVAGFIKELRPKLRLILWDDMLREIRADIIIESGLQNSASPMVWNYLAQMNTDAVGKLIQKYTDVGFRGVWFASAFKGASAIDQQWTPMEFHLNNHLAWLKVMTSMSQYPDITLHGIALTGWQRYEHHTVLCELLPVATPSLAVCLQTLQHGAFNEAAKAKVQQVLGCDIQMKKNICEGSGTFVGSEVYYMVLHIHIELKKQVDNLMAQNHIRGGFSRYHRKYNFANPRNLGFFAGGLKRLLETWENYTERFRSEMEEIFNPDTVEEWVEENINEHLERLRHTVRDVERIAKLQGRPRSLSAALSLKGERVRPSGPSPGAQTEIM